MPPGSCDASLKAHRGYRTLGLTGTPSHADIAAAIKGHVLAMTVLTGTYKRS